MRGKGKRERGGGAREKTPRDESRPPRDAQTKSLRGERRVASFGKRQKAPTRERGDEEEETGGEGGFFNHL